MAQGSILALPFRFQRPTSMARLLNILLWITLSCSLVAASEDEPSTAAPEKKAQEASPYDPWAGTISSDMGCWRCSNESHEEMLDAFYELCNVTMSPMRSEIQETYWTRTVAVRKLRERLINAQSKCLKVIKRLRRELTVDERLEDLKGPFTRWLNRSSVPIEG